MCKHQIVTKSYYMIVVIFDLSPQSKEVGVQLQEDLIKVLNELYTVRKTL